MAPKRKIHGHDSAAKRGTRSRNPLPDAAALEALGAHGRDERDVKPAGRRRKARAERGKAGADHRPASRPAGTRVDARGEAAKPATKATRRATKGANDGPVGDAAEGDGEGRPPGRKTEHWPIEKLREHPQQAAYFSDLTGPEFE